MTRVKRGLSQRTRRKKILKQAKGYFGSKHRLYRTAKEQVMRSLNYAYRDRRRKKRDFRKLWITRINAACREHDLSYSKFIHGLNKAGIEVNRKMLSEIAINDPDNFKSLIQVAKKELLEPIPANENKSNEEVKIDPLNKLTVVELREMAKEQGLVGYSTMRNAELIENLK